MGAAGTAHAGIKFESGVPQDLVSRLGTDQRILAGEIEKLSLYMNPEEAYISRKDCAQVCSLTLEDNIYALLDPVGVRDLEGSLAVLRSLRLAGYPEQLFLYNLALQFRQVYLASFLREQGNSPAEIAKEMNIRFEFIVMRLLKQAQVYNRDELRLALRRIRNGDAAIKSGLREAKSKQNDPLIFVLQVGCSNSSRPAVAKQKAVGHWQTKPDSVTLRNRVFIRRVDAGLGVGFFIKTPGQTRFFASGLIRVNSSFRSCFVKNAGNYGQIFGSMFLVLLEILDSSTERRFVGGVFCPANFFN